MNTNVQQDHVQSLESLKAELALVTDKKADLERRLTGSLQDKDNLMQQLEEANDRIVALERQLKEQVRIMYFNYLTPQTKRWNLNILNVYLYIW